MTGMEKLYRRYFQDVFRFLRGLTCSESLAEELTAETFFRAMKSLNQFRGDCDEFVWLCQIAKNCYFTHLKKQQRIVGEEPLEQIADEHDMADLLEDKELAFRLHQILHDMKEPYKEVFSLRVFGELSFRQIGALFGKTEHWACVTYHRGKTIIRQKLEESS